MENKDISKRTVLVLLVLTLVISVVGTWTILSQPSAIYKTTDARGSVQTGEVEVGILDGPPAPKEPPVGNAGGEVSVNIMQQD